MLNRWLLIFFVSLNILFAKNYQDEKLNIIASKISQKNGIIDAIGDVVVTSKRFYITTKKLIYDTNKATIELIGDITFVQNHKSFARANYLFIDLNKDIFKQTPFFSLSYQNNIWLTSKEVHKKDKINYFEESVLSSCECDSPAWSIKFSSGYENTQTQWLHTFNTRIYIKNIPIFYTPYFGLPTNNKRRTGLLIPTVGYSSQEGFYYSQSYYIAPYPNWDLEIRPQSRGHRGYGVYNYFRWADSPYSTLEIKQGKFVNKSDYQKRYNILHKKHLGWDLEYLRSKVFSSNETHKDNLWISLHNFNDVDYKNLENNKKNNFNKTIVSNINYFYNTPEFYQGVYFTYFKDSTAPDNKRILQELPKIQLHKFAKPLFDKLIYSADLQYTKYDRLEGLRADRYDLNIPLYYNISFLNDYLNLSIKEQFLVSKIKYFNDEEDEDNFTDATSKQAFHIFLLSSDMLKEFESKIHTIDLNVEYVKPYSQSLDGDIYKISNNDSKLSPFPLTKSNKVVSFGLNQSLFDKDGFKEIINHKVKQSWIYDDNDTATKSNLENKLTIYFYSNSLSDTSLYNHQDSKWIQHSTTLKLNIDDFNLNITHFRSFDTPNSNRSDTQTYTLETKYEINNRYSLGYKENYDILKHINNKRTYLFNIDQKCWLLHIKYEDNLVSAPTTTQEALRQEIIYFTYEFKPLGGLTQKYTFKNE